MPQTPTSSAKIASYATRFGNLVMAKARDRHVRVQRIEMPDSCRLLFEIQLLSNMTVTTISSHITSVIAEYGLPAKQLGGFGSQYISEHFRQKCKKSGIKLKLIFSSPYHYKANSLAERTVGTCKRLWSKAQEAKE